MLGLAEIKLAEGIRMCFRDKPSFTLVPDPHHSLPGQGKVCSIWQTAQRAHRGSCSRRSPPRQQRCREQSYREREGIRGELWRGRESAQHKPAGVRRSSPQVVAATCFSLQVGPGVFLKCDSAPLSTEGERGELAPHSSAPRASLWVGEGGGGSLDFACQQVSLFCICLPWAE